MEQDQISGMCCDTARIERGIILQAEDGMYTVQSYGRGGLVTPGIPAMTAGIGPFAAGDRVYFFLFDDGHGAVIGSF